MCKSGKMGEAELRERDGRQMAKEVRESGVVVV